ncbi:hypothetical protein C1Y40_04643 [Mycobacterium talmoniae]|uniref:Uncharacterized protein n=1 Tax=Mycobacterium talmoniae TaxID=1858794 RepID=A0A2S8BEV7_9MYCO|nr:hypothetical protein C1Y40_04643 [Mycobacterium talmoniae]
MHIHGMQVQPKDFPDFINQTREQADRRQGMTDQHAIPFNVFGK